MIEVGFFNYPESFDTDPKGVPYSYEYFTVSFNNTIKKVNWNVCSIIPREIKDGINKVRDQMITTTESNKDYQKLSPIL